MKGKTGVFEAKKLQRELRDAVRKYGEDSEQADIIREKIDVISNKQSKNKVSYKKMDKRDLICS